MEEITQDQFDQMLQKLASENWKVKNLIDNCGYKNLPPHLKKLIDEKLGVERKEIIYLKN